jgi:hypothetical protein
MNTRTPFAILSAERTEYTPEINDWRTRSLEAQLTHRDLSPVQIEGCYKGTREKSFLIAVPGGEAGYAFQTMIPQLARRWGQESWLYVDANRLASLHFCDERPTLILGQWWNAAPLEAKAKDAYSYLPDDGQYYIVREVI